MKLSLQGFAPHISPFTDVRDLGSLLNNSDFTLLTIVSKSFCIAVLHKSEKIVIE